MSSKVTLTGHFTLLDGTPAVGAVLIRPSRSPILDLDGKQIIAGPQRFTLDEEGRFSATLPPTDDPALGERFTYDVMATMHHTNWQVTGLTLPSDMVSVDVLDPPAGVVKEYPTRAEWDALTEVAVAEMEAALDGAETARDTTIDARDVTVVARDETLVARDVTLTARDVAVGAAGETETARTETLTARDTTLTARDETVGARDATLTARDETVGARDATLTARSETITTAGEAEAARDTAVGAAGDAETARDEAVGAAGEAETARLSAWEAVDTPGRQGPPGEVTTAALTTALAGKVTGTGMTLRHDTSVGTRVFLDHPGGSTMLYGDTGWRDVSGVLSAGNFGFTAPDTYARARRNGDQIDLQIRANLGTNMVGRNRNALVTVWTPPVGYVPRHAYGLRGTVTAATSTAIPIALGTVGSFVNPTRLEMVSQDATETWAATDFIQISASWSTAQAWPSTALGTPY